MYSVWPNFARVPGVVRQQLQIQSMSSYTLVMNLSISTIPNQLAYLLRKVEKNFHLLHESMKLHPTTTSNHRA